MAAPKNLKSVEKRRQPKKKKARTEVSSSSESDSDASPPPQNAQAASKEKDAVMKDAKDSDSSLESPPPASKLQPKPSKPIAKPQEDFSAIYLRKITTELADDLDKVREAPDFKAASIPMLIHALKQGEGLYSAEEKRRIAGA